jgi:ABC-type dipeptide/oligopeptide/nickel transport system permease component
MKQFLKVCLVAAIFFIGSQNTEAQNNILEINQAASEKTQSLRKQIKFDKVKQNDVFDAYLKYEKAIAKGSKTMSIEEKQKITESLILTMKSILSEEEYARYRDIEKFN